MFVLVLLAVPVATAESAPKARFKVKPRSPVVGKPTRLDARSSKCKRCRYRWHRLQGKRARKLGKGRGRVLRYRFRSAGVKRIRLTVIERNGRRHRRTRKVRVRRPAGANAPGAVPMPGSPLPPLGQPSCVAGATPAATAGAVRSAVAAGQNV